MKIYMYMSYLYAKLIKQVLLTVLLLITISISNAQTKNLKSNSELPRPKLVVGIVIDQMRWDYLYRYYDRYTDGGFKRLMQEGFNCEKTYINYIPTITAIGHSSVYTGSVPAIHGIAGNDFIVNATGKSLYCTEDTTVQTVGSSSNAGKMSPRNLLVSTITDELKLATNFRSKVIGISLKDRGGILPAGHSADAAYWFDDLTGNWITSTYYMKELPAWIKTFNEQKLAERYLKEDWNAFYNINTYVQSAPDNNRYEGRFAGSTTTTLPVKTSGLFSKDYGIIRTTPFGNTITLELAKAALDHEQLGRHSVTDFLAVSCSSTDYIGHMFGVNSIEIEDTYLRLDRDLALFFQYLDAKVGKGQYLVFLTADHGAAHNPNFLKDHKMIAGYWPSGKVQSELNSLLEEKFHIKNIVSSFSNYQVHLNYGLIEKNQLDEQAIRSLCVQFLKKQQGVAFAVDVEHLDEAAVPAVLKERMINGYNKDRSGAITIILEPGWYSGSANATGTTHGSWNAYDAHIPLLWMGWGIKKGSTNRLVNMTDIAPTLAAILHIQEPNGNIGEPIKEISNQ